MCVPQDLFLADVCPRLFWERPAGLRSHQRVETHQQALWQRRVRPQHENDTDQDDCQVSIPGDAAHLPVLLKAKVLGHSLQPARQLAEGSHCLLPKSSEILALCPHFVRCEAQVLINDGTVLAGGRLASSSYGCLEVVIGSQAE